MTVALLLGAAVGVGLWMIVTGLRPRPAPLADVLAALQHPGRPADLRPTGMTGRVLQFITPSGAQSVDRDRQLALAGVTREAWARDRIVWVLAGIAVPVALWGALATIGVRLPPATLLLAAPASAAGWWLADARLREQVARRRKAFRYALSAYLDLVNIILAGGGGIETALVAAADAGDGWAFAELRRALQRARRINQPLANAFDQLGTELGVPELRELAASIGLAGSQGARIRASLAVKADTLRARQIAETEQAAEATTERMNLPTAVLLLGFLIFVVFPAVSAITGVADQTCVPGTPGTPGCPSPLELTQP